MPFISTTTNVCISKEKEATLKEGMGKAITLIPGKSEAWLMLSFHAGVPMYFKGEDQPAVYAEVSSFGSADQAAYAAMTKELTTLYAELLSVSPSRVYIKYEESTNWGWNSSNF